MAATRARSASGGACAALLGGLLGGLLAAGGARAVDLPEDTRRGAAPRLQRRRRHRQRPGAAGAQERRRPVLAHRPRTTSTRSATPRSTSSPPRARTRRRATNSPSAPTTSTATRRSPSAARTSHEPDYTANSVEPRHRAGGVRRHDDGGARLHARLRQGRQAGLARVLRQRAALAVPPRRDADPDAALDHERERRGARPTTATSAAPTASRACSAPRCRERNPRTRIGARGEVPRRSATSARATRCTPSYRYYSDTWDIKAHTTELGYSRYFGDCLARRCASCATTRRRTRSSTATTRRPRRPTSRATASSAPSTTSASARKVAYSLEARCRASTRSSSTARYEYVRFKLQGLHRHPHRRAVLVQRRASCSCS